LREEEPRSRSGCNDTCSLELGAVGSEVFRGMVMADTTKIVGVMDLAMAVSSTVTTSHLGVVNSVFVIKGFLRRGTRVSGRGCNGRFRFLFFFNERGRRRCVRT
jgi:hypothetical protein